MVPLAIALVVAAVQYFSAHKTVDSETGRVLRGAFSDEQGAALGLQAYRQILASEQVLESGAEADLVRRVAARLVPVIGEAGRGFEWAVSVVRNPQANAFCLPGEVSP